MQLRAAPNKSPHHQDEHCADNAADEAGSLTSLIPAEGLSEVGRDQGAGNSKGSSENEALGSYVLPGVRNLAITPAIKPMRMVQRMLSMVLVPPMIAVRPTIAKAGVARAASASLCNAIIP